MGGVRLACTGGAVRRRRPAAPCGGRAQTRFPPNRLVRTRRSPFLADCCGRARRIEAPVIVAFGRTARPWHAVGDDAGAQPAARVLLYARLRKNTAILLATSRLATLARCGGATLQGAWLVWWLRAARTSKKQSTLGIRSATATHVACAPPRRTVLAMARERCAAFGIPLHFRGVAVVFGVVSLAFFMCGVCFITLSSYFGQSSPGSTDVQLAWKYISAYYSWCPLPDCLPPAMLSSLVFSRIRISRHSRCLRDELLVTCVRSVRVAS